MSSLNKMAISFTFIKYIFFINIFILLLEKCCANDILGCGGFVKSHVSLDFSKIEIALYTKEGSLKEKTECAPTNGYYFLPLYEKGEYVLKVHPPAGWSFEPSQVELSVDGKTDQCSNGQDVNFAFNGFGITGKVITAGQSTGPSGISVQLINENGEVRNTVTTTNGEFYFTPVIPGKYTVKTSHQRWKLDPSQAIVQVKEGNTALPIGVLAVKGYDVKGSIISNGNPISGLYVLLYSKEDSPKFRVEGCKTALLQGVPDAPICHSITDNSGEFSFGLVPAGEYKLLTLAKPPGQATVTYNVKPESVPFSVRHDSLYIKNAFEVTGFTLVGTVLTSAAGSGVSGARVVLDGKPVGTTDAAGKYTLRNLQSGSYSVTFEHEQCELEPVQVTISPNGVVSVPPSRASRWRVCGSVTPPDSRRVAVTDERTRTVATQEVTESGKWCTLLQPGVYSAKVEVSEQEQRNGLQFYPLTQKITVTNAPLSGITFSQLKATLTGTILCKQVTSCTSLTVTLKPLSPDGAFIGKSVTTVAKDGKYKFSDVLPGSVEISVPSERLCWRESKHNVAVTQNQAIVPDFIHTGYVVKFHSSHDIQVGFTSKSDSGTLTLPAGPSIQCVGAAEQYKFIPRGCHRFQPTEASADTFQDKVNNVYFNAVSHAAVIKVISPEPATDVILKINVDDHGAKDVGPLVPLKQPQGGYVYEHTLYMADGEVALVSADSSILLFHPSEPQQVIGRFECQPDALVVRAIRGLILSGKLVPPVPDVAVTLTSDALKLTQVTLSDGKYIFGPLDATKHYTITAEKESYVFSAPDDKGDIVAHKLAEITVELLDDSDGTPLQGALVSVSGGAYRRNLVSGADGKLRFSSLAPGEYFAKPLMKEYKFTPHHKIVTVEEGRTHQLSLRGVRVAWSCVGTLMSLGGVGWAGATVVAAPAPAQAHCATEEATTEHNGAFRIRGLLPKCTYTLQLKESLASELFGLKLVKAPPQLQVIDDKDIEDIRLIAIQPQQITDVNILVFTPNVDHYKTLRISLTLDVTAGSPIYTIKLDAAGYNQYNNPGLMYVLPRLQADNKSYVLQLESSLSKATHTYDEQTYYFTSDGHFKSFTIDFIPKVRSADQELRQTSLLVIPLLVALVIAFLRRDQLLDHVTTLANNLATRAQAKPARPVRPDVLDKASIEQIVNTVNATGKKLSKKKAQ